MLVDFYHLAETPLERVLPRICEKLIADGERLLVVAEPHLLGQLDTLLWGYRRDAFLPHGRSNGEGPDKQPILLASAVEPLNGAANVALAGGQWRDEALAFARIFFFFDTGQLDGARASWRMVKGNPDAEPRFWKQDDRGKWVQGP